MASRNDVPKRRHGRPCSPGRPFLTISRAVSVTVLRDAVRPTAVDKSGPPSDVPARDTNQRLFRGPGLPPVVLFVFLAGSRAAERGRMEVTLGDNDRLDYVLKKFRRQITRAGLFQDMKRKRFYESPS